MGSIRVDPCPIDTPWDVGNTVVYRIRVDGAQAGWVGDTRRPDGPREWWVVWWPDTAAYPRWRGNGYLTQTAAVDALTTKVAVR